MLPAKLNASRDARTPTVPRENGPTATGLATTSAFVDSTLKKTPKMSGPSNSLCRYQRVGPVDLEALVRTSGLVQDGAELGGRALHFNAHKPHRVP